MTKTFVLRGNKIEIDTQFESDLGVYGDTFWSMVEDNRYEPQTFDFIKNCFVPGSTFIDVGAATGCMTIYAAQLGYQVVAIEPQAKVFEALQRNLDLNPEISVQIKAVNALVVVENKHKKGEQEIFFTEGASGPLAGLEENVNLIDLETIFSEIGAKTSVSLKMDIEGVEFNILRNNGLLALLKTRKANMYLSLHPGFLSPLQDNNFLKKFIWRLQAIGEVGNLVIRISRFAQIYNATKTKKLNLFSVFIELKNKSRDFHVTFG